MHSQRLAKIASGGDRHAPMSLAQLTAYVVNRIEAARACKAAHAACQRLFTSGLSDSEQLETTESLSGALSTIGELIRAPVEWQDHLGEVGKMSKPGLRECANSEDGGVLALIAERHPMRECAHLVASGGMGEEMMARFVQGAHGIVNVLARSPGGICLLGCLYRTFTRPILFSLAEIAHKAELFEAESEGARQIGRMARTSCLELQAGVRAACAVDALLSASSMYSDMFADAALELSTLSTSSVALPAVASALSLPNVLEVLLQCVQKGGVTEGKFESDATVHSLAAPSAVSVLASLLLTDPLGSPSMWISQASAFSSAAQRSSLQRPPQALHTASDAVEEAAISALTPRDEDLEEIRGVSQAARAYHQGTLISLLEHTIKPALAPDSSLASLSPTNIATATACLRTLIAMQPRHHALPLSVGFECATHHLAPLLDKTASAMARYDMPSAEGDGSAATDIGCARFWLRTLSLAETCARLLRELVQTCRQGAVDVKSTAIFDAALRAHSAICDSGPAAQSAPSTVPEPEDQVHKAALNLRRELIDLLSPWLHLAWEPSFWSRMPHGDPAETWRGRKPEVATESIRKYAMLLADLLPPTPPLLLQAQDEPDQGDDEHQPLLASRREEAEQSLDERGEVLAAFASFGALSSDTTTRCSVLAMLRRLCCISPRQGEQCIRGIVNELLQSNNLFDKARLLIMLVDTAQGPCGLAALRLACVLSEISPVIDELCDMANTLQQDAYAEICMKWIVRLAAKVCDTSSPILEAHSLPDAASAGRVTKLALTCVCCSIAGSNNWCRELLGTLRGTPIGSEAVTTACLDMNSAEHVDSQRETMSRTLDRCDPSGELGSLLRSAAEETSSSPPTTSSLVALVMDAVTKADLRLERSMSFRTQPSKWMSQVAETYAFPLNSEGASDLLSCITFDEVEVPERIAHQTDTMLRKRKAEAVNRETKFARATMFSEAVQLNEGRCAPMTSNVDATYPGF